MSYNRLYELSVHENNGVTTSPRQTELIARLRAECADAHYALLDNGGSNQCCDWRKDEVHLTDFSRKNPGFVFRLKLWSTEEAEVALVNYFQDGKMSMMPAQIHYPPFDPKKLK